MTMTVTPAATGQAAGPAPVILDYTLTALSRISAGQSGQVGNDLRIHDVLPGSVVRGALAAAWWSGDGPPGATAARFRALFEAGMMVRQAVPEGMALDAISARRCKYPGPTCPAEWHDLARDDAPRACPECGGALDEGRGWSWSDAPRTVAVTRTALEEDETAANDKLFTRRALRSRTVLRGTIVVLDPTAHEEEIEWLLEPREIRVGGQRSHMGRAAWACAAAEARGPRAGASPTGEIAIRTRSPLITVDEFGAPTTDPTSVLRHHWADATVVRRWIRPVRVTGWHMAGGLPKPGDLACESGSTFVVTGIPADAASDLALGLGLRRLEGFGEVEVLDLAALQRFADGPHSPSEAYSAPVTPTDVLDRLLAVLPAGELPDLLAKISSAVATVRLKKSAGSTDLTPFRQEVLRRPWAEDLGGDARDRLLELLDSDDLSAVMDRLADLIGRHR